MRDREGAKRSKARLGHRPFPETFLTTVNGQALAGSPSRKGRGLNQHVTPASLSTRLSLEGTRASQPPPHGWSAATGSHPGCSFCQGCPSHYPLSTHQTPVLFQNLLWGYLFRFSPLCHPTH